MKGGHLIAEARLRAGLSTEELASRIGVSIDELEEWEDGRVSPTFEVLTGAVVACGLELTVGLYTHDQDHDLNLALATDSLTPEARLERMLESQRRIEELIRSARRVD